MRSIWGGGRELGSAVLETAGSCGVRDATQSVSESKLIRLSHHNLTTAFTAVTAWSDCIVTVNGIPIDFSHTFLAV